MSFLALFYCSFLQNNLTRQIALILYSGRSKHALPLLKTNFISDNNIKHFLIENSLLDGTV